MKKSFYKIIIFMLLIQITCAIIFPNNLIARSTNNDLYNKTYELSNSNSTEKTQELFNFIQNSYGKYILSGQHIYGDFNDITFQRIKEKTGKLPAIMGLDLLAVSPSIKELLNYWIPYEGFDKVIDTAIDYANNGGIITFCWHWNLDFKFMKKDANGDYIDPWQAYRPRNIDIDFKAVMENENSEEFKLLERDMDEIALELKKLADKDIPILFRPLHEASGEWFWWSTGGSEAYIKLWRKMYDKFTNEYGLNNLIWVWNGADASWYPGDDYVDICGADIYVKKQDYNGITKYFEKYSIYPKVLALTETGTLFDIDEAFNNNAIWSWFLNWSGVHTIPEEDGEDAYTSLEMWNKVFNHEKVLTLDELPFHSHTDTDNNNICDFCGSTISDNSIVSLYVWDIGEVNLSKLKDEVEYLKVNTLYVQKPSSTSENERLKQIMEFAKKYNIDVFLLDGGIDWLTTGNMNNVTGLIDQANEINQTLDYKLKGVSLDVEFYLADDYEDLSYNEKIELFRTFTDKTKKCCDYANSLGLEYSMALPVWFDTAFGNELENLINYNYDHIAFMNYYKETILNNLDKEVEYAKKHNIKIVSIAELQNPQNGNVGEEDSLYNDGLDVCINTLNEIKNKYKYENLGVSYHYYKPLLDLLERDTNVGIENRYELEIYPYKNENSIEVDEATISSDGKTLEPIHGYYSKSGEYVLNFYGLEYGKEYTLTAKSGTSTVTKTFSYEKDDEGVSKLEIAYTDIQFNQDEIMLGDINGNGKLDINDLALLKLHYLDLKTLTGASLKAADVDGNGRIEVNDIAVLKLALINKN